MKTKHTASLAFIGPTTDSQTGPAPHFSALMRFSKGPKLGV